MAVITSPIKAIRAKCIDCVHGHPREVKLCASPDCPLYPFRMGKNPFWGKGKDIDQEDAQL